jgi:hypothetical protein
MLSKTKQFMDKNVMIIKQQSGLRNRRQSRDNIFYINQSKSNSYYNDNFHKLKDQLWTLQSIDDTRKSI